MRFDRAAPSSLGLGLGLGLAALLSPACAPPPEEPAAAKTCVGRLNVRMPAPSPLSAGGETGDVAYVRVEQDEVTTFEGSVDLFGADENGGDVPVVAVADGAPPELPTSPRMRVSLDVYSSGSGRILGVGRTRVFSCTEDGEQEVPLYLGPANGFAKTAPSPAPRIGASATQLDGGRVLVVGGETEAGAPVAPAAYVYDHDTGELCADECLSDVPAPRVGHTATRLEDGRVVIIGGHTPGDEGVLGDVFVFLPDEGRFERLPASVERRGHAAVLLDGQNVPTALRGQIFVVAGLAGSPAAPVAAAALVDVDAQTVTPVEATLSVARSDATATLLTSGVVLVAGGYDGDGSPTATLDLFDPAAQVFSGASRPCPSAGASGLCAKRAGHRAHLLDDGNVLLFGGDIAPVENSTGEPPVAEVYLLRSDNMLAATAGQAQLTTRVGHTVTRVPCRSSPCPLLALGGIDPSTGEAATPVLISPADVEPDDRDTEYPAAVRIFSQLVESSSRAGHATSALDDGTLYVAGGTEGGTSTLKTTDAVFSFCEVELGSTRSCPSVE